jgi:DNA-binding NarL/FixJ family response regulator
MSGKQAISVLIADDHPTTRAGIRAALAPESDIEVIGEAESGSEAMELVAELRPDILLLDLVMPGPKPYEVERWVRANCPETITLVLTAHDRDLFLAKMVEAGVRGFVTKDESAGALVQAIRQAARGDVVLTGEQLSRIESWGTEVLELWQSLTHRERQVLELLARGAGNKEIAQELAIEVTTVWTHTGNIVEKLGARSRAEAIAWAWRNRITELTEYDSRYGCTHLAEAPVASGRHHDDLGRLAS